MVAFKIVRKIGKMLRGGAGQKEIFLGTLCGVLIGFNPEASLTLALAILITLLLNANVGFTLLGVLVGKMLCLVLAPLSFYTGFFIIHNMGLEGFFTQLVNAPITALMDLNVYAMVGGLPYALLIGVVLGKFIARFVNKIREQMIKAGEHDKINKVAENKLAKFLMWLVFGKQKISTADVLTKQSPLLRKSGLILVGSTVVLGLLLEFLLLDLVVKRELQSTISAQTGAEVDIGKAHLSLAQGKLELKKLQVTDPNKLTHNLIQIDSLIADLRVSDLLRQTFTIDLLSGSTLKRDVLRDKPGKLLEKPQKEKTPKEAQTPEEAQKEPSGKSIDDYLAQADDWKKYGIKAYEYLKQREQNATTLAEGEKPKASKKTAVADAKKLGYLKAAADLVTDRPAWTISTVQITDIQLDQNTYTFLGRRVSSHPELLNQTTLFALQDETGKPVIKMILHFENPALPHELSIHLKNIALDNTLKSSDALPLDIKEGKADLRIKGTFTADQLDLPFILVIHDLNAKVEAGQTVMGMDAETATEVFSAIETLKVEGVLGGSLLSPRVGIDYEKFSANIKEALVASGKKVLSNRADKEIDKAKKQASKELNQLLEGEDGGSTQDQAKGLLKKLF